MKFLAIAAFALFSVNAQVQAQEVSKIQIDQVPNVSPVIEIKVISFSPGDHGGALYEDRIIRGTLYSEDDSSSTLVIYNSARFPISSTKISAEQTHKLLQILSKVSAECPMKILIDRASGQVTRMTPTCDEMSRAATSDDVG